MLLFLGQLAVVLDRLLVLLLDLLEPVLCLLLLLVAFFFLVLENFYLSHALTQLLDQLDRVTLELLVILGLLDRNDLLGHISLAQEYYFLVKLLDDVFKSRYGVLVLQFFELFKLVLTVLLDLFLTIWCLVARGVLGVAVDTGWLGG